MDYQFPLVATNRDGDTRIFYDAESFRNFAYDRTNGGVGGYWMECYDASHSGNLILRRLCSEEWIKYWNEGAKNNWIVRDNTGRVVDKKHFGPPDYSSNSRWVQVIRRRQQERARAAERGDPIPYIRSHHRWHRQGAWTKNGKNGAYNQRKGIKLFEDPKIKKGDFDDF